VANAELMFGSASFSVPHKHMLTIQVLKPPATDAHDFAFPRRDLRPSFCHSASLENRGRRECRALAAPAALCAEKIEMHTSRQVRPKAIRHSLRKWLYGLLRALAGVPGWLASVPPGSSTRGLIRASGDASAAFRSSPIIAAGLLSRTSESKGRWPNVDASAAFDLKFLGGLAASSVGTSNRRHSLSGVFPSSRRGNTRTVVLFRLPPSDVPTERAEGPL
jgi:hypothetical protein